MSEVLPSIYHPSKAERVYKVLDFLITAGVSMLRPKQKELSPEQQRQEQVTHAIGLARICADSLAKLGELTPEITFEAASQLSQSIRGEQLPHHEGDGPNVTRYLVDDMTDLNALTTLTRLLPEDQRAQVPAIEIVEGS